MLKETKRKERLMKSERTKMRLEGLKPLVEAGDAEAQFQSGMLYYPYCEDGEVQLAMALFEKAVAQGHAKATASN